MAAIFKVGVLVRQVLPAPIEGRIIRMVLDENTGEIGYIVESIDTDGGVTHRCFTESDIEVAQ